MISEARRVAEAKSRLAGDGYKLQPAFNPQKAATLALQGLEFLRSEIATLIAKIPNLAVVDGTSTIVVSDLGQAAQDRVRVQMDDAIEKINATFKYLNYAQPLTGKPIIIVMSSQRALGMFNSKKLRKQLKQSLKLGSEGEVPIVILATQPGVDNDLLNRMYKQLAIAYMSEIWSDKPLPAWVQIGIVATCRHELGPRDFEREKIETLRRVQLDGNVNRTVLTTDLTQVDEFVAEAMVNQLRYKNPQGYFQFLFDLKHGDPLVFALEKHFKFTVQYLVYLMATKSGCREIPEITVAK